MNACGPSGASEQLASQGQILRMGEQPVSDHASRPTTEWMGDVIGNDVEVG